MPRPPQIVPDQEDDLCKVVTRVMMIALCAIFCTDSGHDVEACKKSATLGLQCRANQQSCNQGRL
eukprot:3682049-Amphidinium_carterae.1